MSLFEVYVSFTDLPVKSPTLISLKLSLWMMFLDKKDAVSTALLKSEENIFKLRSFSRIDSSLACCNPLLLNGVLVCPCHTFSAFCSVSPCLTK